MTIRIEPPMDLEETITRAAARAGVTTEEYVLQAVKRTVGEDDRVINRQPLSLADAMKPYLGILKGPAGPEDGTGRSWSEIEAPCDPL